MIIIRFVSVWSASEDIPRVGDVGAVRPFQASNGAL